MHQGAQQPSSAVHPRYTILRGTCTIALLQLCVNQTYVLKTKSEKNEFREIKQNTGHIKQHSNTLNNITEARVESEGRSDAIFVPAAAVAILLDAFGAVVSATVVVVDGAVSAAADVGGAIVYVAIVPIAVRDISLVGVAILPTVLVEFAVAAVQLYRLQS